MKFEDLKKYLKENELMENQNESDKIEDVQSAVWSALANSNLEEYGYKIYWGWNKGDACIEIAKINSDESGRQADIPICYLKCVPYSKLTESVENKLHDIKVTFECPECGNVFRKRYKMTPEEAEQTFEEQAEEDCPRCGGNAFPEDYEDMSIKPKKVEKHRFPKDIKNMLNKLVSEKKAFKDKKDDNYETYYYNTKTMNRREADKIFNNDVVKQIKNLGYTLIETPYYWTHVMDSNNNLVSRFRCFLYNTGLGLPNDNGYVYWILADNEAPEEKLTESVENDSKYFMYVDYTPGESIYTDSFNGATIIKASSLEQAQKIFGTDDNVSELTPEKYDYYTKHPHAFGGIYDRTEPENYVTNYETGDIELTDGMWIFEYYSNLEDAKEVKEAFIKTGYKSFIQQVSYEYAVWKSWEPILRESEIDEADIPNYDLYKLSQSDLEKKLSNMTDDQVVKATSDIDFSDNEMPYKQMAISREYFKRFGDEKYGNLVLKSDPANYEKRYKDYENRYKTESEIDLFHMSPEEIDEYYSNEYYNKTQEETDPEKKFEYACLTAALQWMSGVGEDTEEDFIRAALVPTAKNAYNSPDKTDEDYFNQIVFELENHRGFVFNFNK